MSHSDDPIVIKPDQRLYDQVCDRIRSDIVTGSFAGGVHLSESELSNRLQVSRTPVREALRRLESDGLVVGYPHRGYFVRDPTLEEARQAYEARRVVETALCELASERATPVDVAAMRLAVTSARAALDESDRETLLLLNKEIHHLVAKAARNVFLEKHWLATFTFAELLRGRWLSETPRSEEVQHDGHKEIVETIARGDTARVRRLSDEHVRQAWKNVSSRLARAAI